MGIFYLKHKKVTHPCSQSKKCQFKKECSEFYPFPIHEEMINVVQSKTIKYFAENEVNIIIIRNYQPTDETSWLRCRVLSFLDTAYFDNVLRQKEIYENPSIELVAVEGDQVVGLLDLEYELKERTVCSRGEGLGGMIWHIAVHPDYRRKGIGHLLLEEAEKQAKEKKINRLEAWTRDDEWVNKWYQSNHFENVDSYLQVFVDSGDEMKEALSSSIAEFYPVQGFAHYVGDDQETIKKTFKRVHECICFEKKLIKE